MSDWNEIVLRSILLFMGGDEEKEQAKKIEKEQSEIEEEN